MLTEPTKEQLEEFQKLYPHLKGAQLYDAYDRFDRYIELAIRVADRIGPEGMKKLMAEREAEQKEAEEAARKEESSRHRQEE